MPTPDPRIEIALYIGLIEFQLAIIPHALGFVPYLAI